MPKPSIFVPFFLLIAPFGIILSSGHPQNQLTDIKAEKASIGTLAPIILIHGYLANKVFVEGRSVPFPPDLATCPRNWNFQKGWISPLLADRFGDIKLQACLLHMLSLQYNETTKVFSNQPNVNVTFLGKSKFGSVWPLSCLLTSDNFLDQTLGCSLSTGLLQDEAQFLPMVRHFEIRHGYERDVTLLGAPYDWRRTANMAEMDTYFADLTNLIETAVNATGQKAFVVCHSMGNLIVNYYLNRRVGKEWQQKYLNATINVSAPWGGTTVLVEQLLSGNADRLQFGGSLVLLDQTVRNFLRALASTAALLPNTLAFPANQTLATIDGVAYSTGNLDAFLALAKSAHFAPLYRELFATIDAHKYTPMHCVHSNIGNQMPILYNYTRGITKRPQVDKWGEGDLLVNIESLRVCQKWKDAGKLVKQVDEIDGPTHMAILHNYGFYKVVEKIIGLKN